MVHYHLCVRRWGAYSGSLAISAPIPSCLGNAVPIIYSRRGRSDSLVNEGSRARTYILFGQFLNNARKRLDGLTQPGCDDGIVRTIDNITKGFSVERGVLKLIFRDSGHIKPL